MRPTFALIHTWPELKNAEYEVLQRILMAADRCEVNVIVIDNNGRTLWSSPEISIAVGEIPSGDMVDFILSLHFESPKVLDAYSYITLWQPISFYMDFGYQKSIDKVCTHNDLLSCASDIADAHGLNLMAGVGRRPVKPLIKMFHTLPEPFLEPSTTETSNLFYIGINWERIGRPKGRFHDVLINLDSKGLVDIYGPENVLGVAPWEGFESYRGELLFDGESVKHAINRSGICLALSSAPHKAAGIMSNRLFEGLAGGAAVIATPNALIDKYFADVVYLVDDSRGEQVLGQQILEAVRRIRGNPAEARARTREGQRILRESCSLESSIRQMVAQTPQRIADHEKQFLSDVELDVCLVFRGGTLEDLKSKVRQIAAQKRSKIGLHILCDVNFASRYGKNIASMAGSSLASIKIYPLVFDTTAKMFDGIAGRAERTGFQIDAILKKVKAPYFAILNDEDTIFSEHFASLAKALENDPMAMFACSGMLVDEEDATGARKRTLADGRFNDLTSILMVESGRQSGRFLYRSSLIKDSQSDLFSLLDGEENGYFRLSALLSGPLAQTAYSTYVMDQTVAAMAPSPSEPVNYQRQYIRDLFARDPRWLERMAVIGMLPKPVFASGTGVSADWGNQSPPALVSHRILPNQRLPTRSGEIGTTYLFGGFSEPESDCTWIAGERGIIEFTIDSDSKDTQSNYEIILEASGRRSLQHGREQHCTVALNGKVIAYLRVPESETLLRLAVPMQRMGHPSRFRLELIPDHSDQVFDAEGHVTDERRLSICLKSIEIRCDVVGKPPLLEAGVMYECREGSEGARALFSGFHAPEENLSWIAGTRGTLRFGMECHLKNPVLKLQMAGRRGLESGEMPDLTLVINGINLGTHRLQEENFSLTVPLNNIPNISQVIWLNLTVSHAEAVFNESHEVVDSRLIGAALIAFGIFEDKTSKRQRVL